MKSLCGQNAEFYTWTWNVFPTALASYSAGPALDSMDQLLQTRRNMKSNVFWDITPCSPLSINRRFGGTSPPAGATCFRAGFLLNLFFGTWRRRRYVPPKRQLTLNGLHGLISQKIVLFITTAVRTSNPTQLNFSPSDSKRPSLTNIMICQPELGNVSYTYLYIH
jgi:hypothetical protein